MVTMRKSDSIMIDIIIVMRQQEQHVGTTTRLLPLSPPVTTMTAVCRPGAIAVARA